MQALRSASKIEQQLGAKEKTTAHTKIERIEAFRDHGNMT
jgi:hypothetical protein